MLRAPSPRGTCAAPPLLRLCTPPRRSRALDTASTVSLHASAGVQGVARVGFRGLYFCIFGHFMGNFDEIDARARWTPWIPASGARDRDCMFATGLGHVRTLWSPLSTKRTREGETGLLATAERSLRPDAFTDELGHAATTTASSAAPPRALDGRRRAFDARGAPAAPAQTAPSTPQRRRAGSLAALAAHAVLLARAAPWGFSTTCARADGAPGFRRRPCRVRARARVSSRLAVYAACAGSW